MNNLKWKLLYTRPLEISTFYSQIVSLIYGQGKNVFELKKVLLIQTNIL